MILITGTSWGSGEWGFDHCISHAGLGQYIIDSGKPVLNLCQPGFSGNAFFNVLDNFVKSNKHVPIEKIIVFDSNYLHYFMDMLYDDVNIRNTCISKLAYGIDHFISFMMNRFYSQLSFLAVRYNIPVVVVGCFNDTADPDNFSEKFPMVTIGCQSFVNLLLNGSSRLDKPVNTVAIPIVSVETIQTIKKHLVPDELEKFLDYLNAGTERGQQIKQNKEFFWPDSTHPNRTAHKILFDYLLKNSML